MGENKITKDEIVKRLLNYFSDEPELSYRFIKAYQSYIRRRIKESFKKKSVQSL